MGFSVSGAAAIVFLGLFISFGAFYTTAADGAERVIEAKDDAEDAALARQHTELNVTSVSYDAGTSELTVAVNNTGERTLSIDDTDLLVDGAYRTTDSSVTLTTAAGGTPSSSTDIWRPGEQLTYTVTVTDPARVKVVTEHGIAEAEVV